MHPTNKDGHLSLVEMPPPKNTGKMLVREDLDRTVALFKAEADAMKEKMADRMGKHGKGKHDGKGHGGFWFWDGDDN